MAKKAKEKVVNEVEESVEEKVSAFKVIQTFKDKNTLEVYAIGDTYEANSKRLKELQSKGFIEEVKDDEQPSE